MFFFVVFCLFLSPFAYAQNSPSEFEEFQQSAFNPKDLLKSPAHQQWESIGIRQHHGINIPLFSIYSNKSFGVGEFPDLLLLFSWIKELGFDTIQLLPINDCQDAPYLIYSTQALDFIYLCVGDLPHAQEMPGYKQLVKTFIEEGRAKRLQWQFVRVKKEIFLKEYFTLYFESISKTEEYQDFLKNNAWLDDYALFKVIKRCLGEIYPWDSWPDLLRTVNLEALQNLRREYFKQIDFHKFIQFFCFKQLVQVKQEASKQGILLLGDQPFLPMKDSADVWINQKLFFIQSSTGAPPDMFSEIGQDWGLPVYNWPEIKKTGYQFWLDRIKYSGNFFHIYRIDHAYGLFRTWNWKDIKITVDKMNKKLNYKRGFYFPIDASLWIENGRDLLSLLVQKFPQMPICEDIGNYEPQIQSVIFNSGIPGIRLLTESLFRKKIATDLRQQASAGVDEELDEITFGAFPPHSITTTATHDTQPLRLWWANTPKKATTLANYMGWKYDPFLSKEQLFELLKLSHHTPSLFHINLITEYLDLTNDFSEENPRLQRVNVPGSVSEFNWSYRLKAPLEEIIANHSLKENMKRLLSKEDFVPSPEKEQKKVIDLARSWLDLSKEKFLEAKTIKDPDLVSLDEIRKSFNEDANSTKGNFHPFFLKELLTEVSSYWEKNVSKNKVSGEKTSPIYSPKALDDQGLAYLQIALKVKEAYWDWVGAAQLLQESKQSLARLMHQYELAQDMLDIEIIQRVDIYPIQAFVNKRKRDYALAEINYNKALYHLEKQFAKGTHYSLNFNKREEGLAPAFPTLKIDASSISAAKAAWIERAERHLNHVKIDELNFVENNEKKIRLKEVGDYISELLFELIGLSKALEYAEIVIERYEYLIAFEIRNTRIRNLRGYPYIEDEAEYSKAVASTIDIQVKLMKVLAKLSDATGLSFDDESEIHVKP